MDWFPWLLIGHFLGDFVFQNNWMALNKKEQTYPCFIHCTIYSCIVTLFLMQELNFSLFLFLFIFLSHYILDGTHLVDKWMKFYDIRSWDSSLPRAEDRYGKKTYIIWTEHPIAKDVVITSFGSILYVVIDNILHITMMTLGIKYLFS